MRIVGVLAAGTPQVVGLEVGHGEDPHALLWQHGFFVQRLLSVSGSGSDLTVTAQVARHQHPGTELPTRTRGLDAGLRLAPGEEPIPRQRVAAYAIVLSSRGMLATQFSGRTAVPGLWGLPGGGMDGSETASQTIVREVYEETGQHAVLDHVLDMQSDHWIGRSPSGAVEDFHALRLIYAASCDDPTDPVVHDTGGTTAASRWLPPSRWRRFSWTAGFRTILARHLEALVPGEDEPG